MFSHEIRENSYLSTISSVPIFGQSARVNGMGCKLNRYLYFTLLDSEVVLRFMEDVDYPNLFCLFVNTIDYEIVRDWIFAVALETE